MSADDNRVRVAGDESLLLDRVFRAPLAFVSMAEEKALSELDQDDSDIAQAFKGRSPRPGGGQLLHLLVNRLSKRAFDEQPSTERSSSSIANSVQISMHRFATELGVEYKRFSAACSAAAGYGWVGIQAVNHHHGTARRYRQMLRPTRTLLRSVQDHYLGHVRGVVASLPHEALRWLPKRGGRVPLAFRHGLTADDAALIDAARRLPAAWKKLLVATVMQGADGDRERWSRMVGEVSPEVGTSDALVWSELGYHLVHRLILLAASSARLESNRLVVATFAEKLHVSEKRVHAQVGLIVHQGWAEYIGDEGNVGPTERLIRDFQSFYLPALRTVWGPNGSKGRVQEEGVR